jgi:hypothetical protein
MASAAAAAGQQAGMLLAGLVLLLVLLWQWLVQRRVLTWLQPGGQVWHWLHTLAGAVGG